MRRTTLLAVMGTLLGACSNHGLPDGVALQQELTAQEQSLRALSHEVATAATVAAAVRVSTPPEIRALRKKLADFQGEFLPKWDALEAPVAKAQQALDAANADLKRSLAAVRIPQTNEQGFKLWCGGDGCGGTTCQGRCQASEVCFGDHCTCVPSCAGKACGSDGCGGFCGENGGKCADGQVCQQDGSCIAQEYDTLPCTPSCALDGQTKLRAREKPMQDFSPRFANADTTTPASSADLDAWVKALEAHGRSLDEQLAELGRLGASLEEAQKSLTTSKANVTTATTAEKAAVASALVAKKQPADFPAAVTATAELKTAIDKLKVDERAVADLTAKVGQSKFQSEILGKAAARNKAELARVTAVLVAAKDLDAKVAAAKEALGAATTTRDLAREELLKGEGAPLEQLAEELQLATQSILTLDDLAYLGCDGTECSVATIARADQCRGKLTAALCPGALGPSGLAARLNAAAARRRKASAETLDAPDTIAARDALNAALKVALVHSTALEPVETPASAGTNAAGALLARVSARRTTTGGVTASALQELEAFVQGQPASSLRTKVKDVLDAAMSVPSIEELEQEVAVLGHLAVLVESVAATHSHRATLLTQGAGLRGLAASPSSATLTPPQACESTVPMKR